jgi:hypothetical protein
MEYLDRMGKSWSLINGLEGGCGYGGTVRKVGGIGMVWADGWIGEKG